jgi:ABC-type transport system involved in cytochrome c biogenesis permease subunit
MNSSLLLSVTTFAYFGSTALYLSGVVFRLKSVLTIGSLVALGTLIIQTVGIGLRWKESYDLGYGHAPLSNLYESLVFAAWAIMLLYLIMEYRTRQRTLGVFPALFAFLAMAYASFSTSVDAKIQPLLPALKSNWLIAHVITCFLGYAAFAVACGISILYLIKKTNEAGAKPGAMMAMMPESRQLDELNYQLGLGDLLELGSQGNVVAHYLAGVRRRAARPDDAGLERQTGGLVVACGFRMCPLHLFRREFSAEWSSQLCHPMT